MHMAVEHLASSAAFIKSCLNEQVRLLYSVPSKRLDVGDTGRDQHGRLFLPDQADRLQSMFEQLGFTQVSKWTDSDSFCRDAVEWVSVLMTLERA